MNAEIQKILDIDMAHLSCLMELFSDHPDIQDNSKLYGAFDAIRCQYTNVWNRLEAELDKSLVLSLAGDPGDAEKDEVD